MKCILLLFVIATFADFSECQRKVSPCPSVFSYDQESDTADTWYGTIKLQTSVPLHGITVDVIFDRRAATFGAYYFTDVSTNDYTEYRVENKNFKLDPGRTLVMNVYARYTSLTPQLKQIRLNGQNICVDVPSATIQPIYSNSQPSTKRTTRRENPNYDGFDYDTTASSHRNTFATTTQSWNDFGNGGNGFTQYSGHETSRPSNTGRETYNNGQSSSDNNNNDFYNPPRESSTQRSTTKGQGRDPYNPPRDISTPRPPTHNRDIYNQSPSNNQNRDVYNSPRENSTPRTANSNDRDVFNQPIPNNLNNNNRDTSQNNYGFIADSLDNTNSNNNNNNHNLATQRPFNQQTPTTTNYDYNRRTTASSYRPNSTTKKSTYFYGDLPFLNNEETSTHSILNLDGDSQCGSVIPKVNPLIVHGEETYQGQFPWHAALYLSEVGSLKYICGGSLVSMNAVITAAHCVTHSKSKVAIDPDNLLVYLGKNNLQKWTGPEQDAKVADIIVNSEYDPERFYSDLAVLKLKATLLRSNFVRPICLWNFDTDLKLIVNKLGSVPGWGYNEDGLVSEDLSYVRMPVVTHETCIWSNRDFFSKVTSDKAFCAGFRNGTSICNGDSGGGMVFKQGKQFYLRGIVSISIALQNSLKCDSNQFAVFVDAAKYTTWIKQNI